MELNYNKDVRINESALDLEWLDQAELAIKYGKEFALAHAKVLLLDEKVKVIRSELINKAWSDPQKYLGQPKGSIQTVEAYYRTHKKHKKAKQELIKAQEELNFIEIAKNEIAFTRKAALENMVKLFTSSYFAGPNVPRDLTKLRTHEETRQDAIEKQVKRKRKSK